MRVVKFCFLTLLMIALMVNMALAERPEVLLGISTDFNKGEITIEVTSSGCTMKGDFRFDFKENVLTIIRTRRDDCKAMPKKINLTYSLKEVGISPHQPFSISNKFIVNENIANIR